MSPFKLLHLATHSGVYRGGAVQACRMAEGLVRRGHDVTLLAAVNSRASAEHREADAASWESLRRAGVHVHLLDYSGPAGILRLRRYIRRGGFDLVHAHRDDALLAAWLGSWGGVGPALVAQRGTESVPSKWPRRAFASPRVRAVVAVAEAVREALSGAVPEMDAGKIEVIYGSVDMKKFAPRPPDPRVLASLNLPAGAYVVGSLSAYRGPKGFKYLVSGLRRAMQHVPSMHAIFLGKDVAEHVRPLAEQTGFIERFHFVGHQEDVASWLSVMDVTVVAATRREGLSGVLRESLAAGVPAISTDCAGNRELVRDHDTGLLVPVRSAKALRDALVWAQQHPAEMKLMAGRGREWVGRHCTIETQCAALEALYERVLGRVLSRGPGQPGPRALSAGVSR